MTRFEREEGVSDLAVTMPWGRGLAAGMHLDSTVSSQLMGPIHPQQCARIGQRPLVSASCAGGGNRPSLSEWGRASLSIQWLHSGQRRTGFDIDDNLISTLSFD